jgi:serine/threonine protein kinase
VLNELKISTLLSLDPEHHFVKPYYFFLHHFPADPNSLPGKKPERRLVMDYVAGGDLFHLLKTVGLVHWEDTISLAYLLLHALKYAHSKGVIYRDLKPENILIDADTGFKITDFDQAARFKKDKQYPKDFAGTDVYMAPELFLDEPYTETVDTWSVGAVLLKVS